MPSSYEVRPPQPIAIEVRGRDGTRLLIRGTLDAVPWSAGRQVQWMLVVDAVARPMGDDEA